MKIRERLAKMRKSTRFGEMLMLANDMVPGTKFDEEIRAADLYREDESDQNQRASNAVYRNFENRMRLAIKGRDSQLFRDLAEAIAEHLAYKSNRKVDRLRKEILGYAMSEDSVSVKGIVKHLKGRRIQVTPETRRIIRRIRHELGIKLNGISGRPRDNGDTETVK
jgi:hypothetical protein